jgi:hypothetical protein
MSIKFKDTDIDNLTVDKVYYKDEQIWPVAVLPSFNDVFDGTQTGNTYWQRQYLNYDIEAGNYQFTCRYTWINKSDAEWTGRMACQFEGTTDDTSNWKDFYKTTDMDMGGWMGFPLFTVSAGGKTTFTMYVGVKVPEKMKLYTWVQYFKNNSSDPEFIGNVLFEILSIEQVDTPAYSTSAAHYKDPELVNG